MIPTKREKTSADRELLSHGVYESVFEKLEKKVSTGGARKHSYAIYPDLTLAWALAHKKEIIRAIHSEIKKSDFTFDTLKLTTIVSDKPRDIYIAAWPERILMLALGHILSEGLAGFTSAHVYSFQKGRGAHEAIRNATTFVKTNNKKPLYVIKRDVAKYGNSIPQPKLFAALEIATGIQESPLFYRLVRAAIRAPSLRESSGPIASMCVGVPSGSPLVPPLENFYLSPLDRKLGDTKGAFYGRYGDDFLFMTPDKAQADWARELITSTVNNLGLQIKVEKELNGCLDFSNNTHCQIYRHLTHITWLGFSITNHGLVGIKPDHLHFVLKNLESEIKSLFARIINSGIEPADQREVIKQGITLLLQKDAAGPISAYLYNHKDHTIYKLIDRNITQIVLKQIRLSFKLGKKNSWKFLRNLKIPSTYYIKFLAKKKSIARKENNNAGMADTATRSAA